MASLLYSNTISEFIKVLNDSKTKARTSKELMETEDKITQDILHMLELEETTYKQRCKLMTRLSDARKTRRYYKDILSESEVINSWVEQYPDAVKMLSEMLGRLRKEENYHKDRKYYPRTQEIYHSQNDTTKENKDNTVDFIQHIEEQDEPNNYYTLTPIAEMAYRETVKKCKNIEKGVLEKKLNAIIECGESYPKKDGMNRSKLGNCIVSYDRKSNTIQDVFWESGKSTITPRMKEKLKSKYEEFGLTANGNNYAV